MRLTALFLTLSCVAAIAMQSDEEKSAARYYDKWLNQDILYIITDDERAVFSKLSTPEEKEQFIEQFWQHRLCKRQVCERDPRVEDRPWAHLHHVWRAGGD